MAEMDAESSEMAKRIGGPPDLEPLASIVKGKAFSESPAMQSLRAMGEGGWRTQSDLFNLGLVDCNLCQACFDNVGTFLHRCVGCSSRAETRNAYKNQRIIRQAQRADQAENPLFK